MARVRAPRVKTDSFATVIRAFLDSQRFKGYEVSTQEQWRRELRNAENPDNLGLVPVFGDNGIRPKLIAEFLEALADRPGKQYSTYGALKQLEKWAVVRELVPRWGFMLGIETPDGAGGGRTPWTMDHVTIAEANARQDLGRAVTLALSTGQRGSDLVRMRWSDIELDRGRLGVNVIQMKTKKHLWVPFAPWHARLLEGLQTWERVSDFILVRPRGGQWSRSDLSKYWTDERRKNPHLKPLDALGLSLHGLRASCVIEYRRRGLSALQIADTVGMSPEMVQHYCRLSEQRLNAHAGQDALERQ